MTLAADVLFRWTDDSFAITGWGSFFVTLMALILAARSSK